MKKYLLVIYCHWSYEVYLYNSIDALLKEWEFNSIEELISSSDMYRKYVVYEISNIYERYVLD